VNLADCLGGVSVKRDFAFTTDRTDFCNRLQNSGFIVRGHDGDQNGVGPQCAAKCTEIEQAITLDG